MTAFPGELAGWPRHLFQWPTLRTMGPNELSGAVGFAFCRGLEMVVIDRTNSILSYGPFTEQMRQKSCRRRDQQERLADRFGPTPAAQ